MKYLLKQILEKAIELADLEFNQEQIQNKWLGTFPASETEISITEQRLRIELPTYYKEFILITNGFSAPNDIEPSFENINKIDYLRNIDKFVIEAYSIEGIEDIGKQLENSIVVGGLNEEQYFLLIPPSSTNKQWKYWKFANWYPGEEEFENLETYFKEVLEFLNNQF